MTNREFFNAVINGTITEEMVAHAHGEIAKLDERNRKRAETPSKTQIANEPIIKAIAEVLTNEPKLASEIAEAVGVSVNKVSALVKKIDGVVVTEVKVKGKGVRKAYSIA